MSDGLISIGSVTLGRTALALLLALALAALWLAPPAAGARQRHGLLFTCLVLSALTALAELLVRSAALADVTLLQAWSFIPRVLTHSDYGHFWLLRATLWGLMAALSVWIWRRGWHTLPSGLLLLAAVATAFLISATGHGGEDGLWSVANLMNWLHLISTSVWGGAVILYAFTVLPALRGGDLPQVAAVGTRLSTVATAALVIVLFSGLFNSWHQLGRLADLWSTAYGRVLLFKLALVAVMMAIGALNRFRLVPQLAACRGETSQECSALSARFLQVLRIDSAVFISVLVSALVLGMQSPPAHGP